MTLVLHVTTVVSQATCPGSVNSREECGEVFVRKTIAQTKHADLRIL